MDAVELHPNAKVVLQTEKSTLCIEKLNDSHGVINGGCNTYKIRFAIIEMAFGTYALLVVPTSGKQQAYLEPPEHLVLNFWDQKLNGSGYELMNGDNTFTLDNFGIRTRYVIRFEDDIEHARCMELFFITRRMMLERAREIESRKRDIAGLQDEVLAAMKLGIPPAYVERV